MVLRLSPIAAGIRACSRIYTPLKQPCTTRYSLRGGLGSSRLYSFAATARRQQDLPQRSPGPSKPVYPPQLQIYDAGIQKTAFIQTSKVTSVAMFVLYCSVLAPQFYYAYDEAHGVLKALGVAGIGAIPMTVLGYATAPFVNSVLLRLPQTARRSRDAMIHYVQHLPKDAELEFVTTRTIGFKKTSAVRLSEMHTLPPRRLRFANLEHMKPEWQKKLDAQRPMWEKVLAVLGETRSKFYVKNDKAASKRSRAPGVWDMVLKQIQQNRNGK